MAEFEDDEVERVRGGWLESVELRLVGTGPGLVGAPRVAEFVELRFQTAGGSAPANFVLSRDVASKIYQALGRLLVDGGPACRLELAH